MNLPQRKRQITGGIQCRSVMASLTAQRVRRLPMLPAAFTGTLLQRLQALPLGNSTLLDQRNRTEKQLCNSKPPES